METYRKRKDILRLAFCICEGTRELRELTGSVYVCENEMEAKMG